jgi:hypothetical protein
MAKGLKTGGRTKGTPNKITSAFKDAVRTVYEDIGGHRAFAEWARENPGDFYRIAARLIPTEVHSTGLAGLTILVDQHFGGALSHSLDAPAEVMLLSGPSR